MSQPTTVLTDYLLALAALGSAWRLYRRRARPSVPTLLWAASFAALGVAAVVGGTWHGIPRGVLPSLRRSLWCVTYVAIGLADLLILAGATWAALARRPRLAILALLAGRFLIYVALVLGRRDFRYVAYEFGLTIVLLLVFGLDLARRGNRAAAFVLGGVLASLAGGIVLSAGLDLHPQFNNNDLFHVIQTLGVCLFYNAGLLLRAR